MSSQGNTFLCCTDTANRNNTSKLPGDLAVHTQSVQLETKLPKPLIYTAVNSRKEKGKANNNHFLLLALGKRLTH